MSDLPLYDSTNEANYPAAGYKAGYGDGRYTNFAALKAQYGDLAKIDIDVTGNPTGQENCVDIETGDATPADAPRVVRQMIANGFNPPWLYCDKATWEDVVDVLIAAGIPPAGVKWWIADYTGSPHFPTYDGLVATACQYSGGVTARFDTSCVQPDAFTTVVTSSPPPIPPPSTPQGPPVPTLSADIVCTVPTPTGKGYWDIGSDGGIYAFGDADAFSSNPVVGLKLSRPIVSAVSSPSGKGLLLTGGDGGKFALGDAINYGSLPALGYSPAPEAAVQH